MATDMVTDVSNEIETSNDLKEALKGFGTRISEAISRSDFKAIVCDQYEFSRKLIDLRMDDERKIKSLSREVKRLQRTHQLQILDCLDNHRKERTRLRGKIRELELKIQVSPDILKKRERFAEIMQEFRNKRKAKQEAQMLENGVTNLDD